MFSKLGALFGIFLNQRHQREFTDSNKLLNNYSTKLTKPYHLLILLKTYHATKGQRVETVKAAGVVVVNPHS